MTRVSLTYGQVVEIYNKLKTGTPSGELASEYGASIVTVNRIKAGNYRSGEGNVDMPKLSKNLASKDDPIRQRILDSSSLIISTGCWEWEKHITKSGYGTISINGKSTRAHRASYEAFVGKIPDGLVVCHKCDNPRCCNPDHLFVGTFLDNTIDHLLKGRKPVGAKTGRAILSEGDALKIIELFATGMTIKQVAEVTGFNYSTVQHVRNGDTWSHITGIPPKYRKTKSMDVMHPK